MTKSRQRYFESRLTALREFYVRLWCLQMENLIQTQSAYFFLGVKGKSKPFISVLYRCQRLREFNFVHVASKP